MKEEDLILYGIIGVGAFVIINSLSKGKVGEGVGNAIGGAAVATVKETAIGLKDIAVGIAKTEVYTPKPYEIFGQTVAAQPQIQIMDLLFPFSYPIKQAIQGYKNIFG